MKNFGLSRVVSPKGVLPVAAWELDNSPRLGVGEAILHIEKIQIEKESFAQICSSCGYDKEKIKSKIIDIINKRGKLQNPNTKTGGVFIGRMAKLDKSYINSEDFQIGERVCCVCSTCGIPMKIESIDSIDFTYGQIQCSGYAIVFDTTPLRHVLPGIKDEIVLSAVDEAGNLYGLYKIAKSEKIESAMIIGNNPIATMLYAQAMREAIRDNNIAGRISAIIDDNSLHSVKKAAMVKALEEIVDEMYFVDLVRPIEAVKELMPLEDIYGGIVDKVVVIEDVFGAESLAISIVKRGGHVFFSSAGNHYWTAAVASEGLGKEVHMHVFDQYVEEHPEFTFKLVREIYGNLEKAIELWQKINEPFLWNVSEDDEDAKGTDITSAITKGNFVFKSLDTRQMVEEAINIAKYDCNLIIQGETGVGKEKILELIHENSSRRGEPCIKINCATISESLAESELFGYEEGAFTGARIEGKRGYFEMANNGILFLDEIGSLPMHIQSKLLRVIQESQFYKVGGTKPVNVNVRVIVASNVPLKELVDSGAFREDLYYRLNICTIDVPPLRERRDDIPCLAEYFVNDWSTKYSVDKELEYDAMQTLYYHSWPGNVRELENVMHRLVIKTEGNKITKLDVDQLIHGEQGESGFSRGKNLSSNFDDSINFREFMDEQEKEVIAYAMEKAGSTRKAANLLGLPQTTFARKKLKHGL